MSDIDSWIAEQLIGGLSKDQVKGIMDRKGYSARDISRVDRIDDPYVIHVKSQNFDKSSLLIYVGFFIVASVLIFGSYIAYREISGPDVQEIISNLSIKYGTVLATPMLDQSMEPSIKKGQILFIADTKQINTGDIVLANIGTEAKIVRVVGKGGDFLSSLESNIEVTLLEQQIQRYNGQIPLGTVVLLPDNSNMLDNNRKVGLIPETYIKGKVVKVI